MGSEMCIRDSDVVDGIILSMKSVSGVYNIASGNGTSIVNLAKLLIELSGKNSKIVYQPARKAEIIYSVSDITKSQNKLGFNPKIILNEGLKTL